MNEDNNKDSILSFEECLKEEFLVNTSNYPTRYHELFKNKFNRAYIRYKKQSSKSVKYNDDDDYSFVCCDRCDLPDACSDFGCAIKTGVRKEPEC